MKVAMPKHFRVSAPSALAPAIRDRFSAKLADGNCAAATAAYEFVAQQLEGSARV